jgi:hypothetical protein
VHAGSVTGRYVGVQLALNLHRIRPGRTVAAVRVIGRIGAGLLMPTPDASKGQPRPWAITMFSAAPLPMFSRHHPTPPGSGKTTSTMRLSLSATTPECKARRERVRVRAVYLPVVR